MLLSLRNLLCYYFDEVEKFLFVVILTAYFTYCVNIQYNGEIFQFKRDKLLIIIWISGL